MNGDLSDASSISRRGAVALLIILQLIAIPLIALPLWWGALSPLRGYSIVDFGVLQTGAGVANFASGLVLAAVMHRVDWRGAIIMLALAYTAALSAIWLTIPASGVAMLWGIVTGAALSIESLCFAMLGRTAEAQRYAGLYVTIQTILYSIVPLMVPVAHAAGGFSVLHASLVASVCLVIPGAALLPRYRLRNAARYVAIKPAPPRLPSLNSVYAIAAMSTFIWFTSTIFMFSEQLGAARGLGLGTIGTILGITMLAGLPGSMLIAALGDRMGPRVPVIAGTALALVAGLLLYLTDTALAGYVIGLACFSLAWSLMMPSLLTIFAQIDPSGRALTLSYPARALVGIVLSGAMTAGLSRFGLSLVILMTTACALMSCVLYLLAWKRSASAGYHDTNGLLV
jgi:hypothetical protein